MEKGMITRIHLKNFGTYDKLTVNFKRHINVIIRPNDSNKSIVTAIVLGLESKPNIIGRALHVGEYVKFGRDSAMIEIHLKNGIKQDSVVTRTITKEGKSTWMINGNQANDKSVKEFTSNLNIQVDNFCQFLSQDKVQDFSKMDAQALLENTERSVGDPKLLEYHLKLKEQRTIFKALEVDVANTKRLLKSKTQRRDQLQVVATIKESKLINQKIVTLMQKRAWILYNNMERKLGQSKKNRDLAVTEMQEIEAELKKVKQIKSDMTTLKNLLDDQNKKLNAENTKLANIKEDILSCVDEFENTSNILFRNIQECTRDQDIKFAQNQKSKLENELALTIDEVGSEESLTEQLTILTTSIEEHNKEIDSLTNKYATLDYKNKNAVQAEHHILNIDVERLKFLKQKDIDSYNAVLWLEENRDKFSATVHLPMLLNINIKEVSYVKYLENIIPFRDLIAFICEDKEDMNLLKCLTDQQKLNVNVIFSDPKRASMRPSISLEKIKKFGFKHYLIDFVEMPFSVMNYLVSMYHLNNIPIGTNEVQNNTNHIPENLSCYFSENDMYSVSTCKHKPSIQISRIKGNGMLSTVLNISKQQKFQELVPNLQERNRVLNEIEEVQKKIQEETKVLDEYIANRNKYQQNIYHIRALKDRIQIAVNKIKRLEMGSMNIDDMKAAYNKEFESIMKNQAQMTEECNLIHQKCLKYSKSNIEIIYKINMLRLILLTKENDVEYLKNKFTSAEKTFKNNDEEFQILNKTTERLYNEASTSTHNIRPQDDAFKTFNKAFEKLPATVAEINNELTIAQAKVFCMVKNMDAETIPQEYEKIQNDIQKLTELVKKQTDELEEMTRKIEILKQEWFKPLKQLVKKINENFSFYFFAMNCAGEVTLSHGENVLDFDQYGLEIKVKFRDADELQELTKHFQSDGERMATIAIYMMALQKLSRVPFHCVDEIYQDMDAVNEERVFDLLLKIAGRPDSSQYIVLAKENLTKISANSSLRVD